MGREGGRAGEGEDGRRSGGNDAWVGFCCGWSGKQWSGKGGVHGTGEQFGVEEGGKGAVDRLERAGTREEEARFACKRRDGRKAGAGRCAVDMAAGAGRGGRVVRLDARDDLV